MGALRGGRGTSGTAASGAARSLGDLQLAVMNVVWDRTETTVPEVHAALAERGLAYTTILTTMQSLERHGFLERLAGGRAFRYRPRVARGSYRSAAVGRLVRDVFAGEPVALLTHLLGDEPVTPQALARLRARVSSARGAAGGRRRR